MSSRVPPFPGGADVPFPADSAAAQRVRSYVEHQRAAEEVCDLTARYVANLALFVKRAPESDRRTAAAAELDQAIDAYEQAFDEWRGSFERWWNGPDGDAGSSPDPHAPPEPPAKLVDLTKLLSAVRAACESAEPSRAGGYVVAGEVLDGPGESVSLSLGLDFSPGPNGELLIMPEVTCTSHPELRVPSLGTIAIPPEEFRRVTVPLLARQGLRMVVPETIITVDDAIRAAREAEALLIAVEMASRNPPNDLAIRLIMGAGVLIQRLVEVLGEADHDAAPHGAAPIDETGIPSTPSTERPPKP